mmetsp:Transcript_60510/g.171935  ORF Transcript_60510/g.171935 Transcript_60510/m.171935 type:complete len:419 (+) Transcript_60510:89-1345(+)
MLWRTGLICFVSAQIAAIYGLQLELEPEQSELTTSLMKKVELFLPMWNGDTDDYIRYFDRTSKLFWPAAKILVLMDKEKEEDHKVADRLLAESATRRTSAKARSFRVEFNEDTPGMWGHDRQQLRMFEADVYTDSEYIGFVDTDAVFTTPVVEETLFEDGKPIIIGRIGKYDGDPGKFWSVAPLATEWATGTKEIMRCMDYFPVVVKRQHIIEMREWFSQKHGKSFSKFFNQLKTSTTPGVKHRPYSQFNMMCQWLYHNKHDDYVWHLHQTDPEWSRHHHVEGQVDEKDLQAILAAENTKPLVRVAQHAHYDNIASDYDLAKTMAPGVCNSVDAASRPSWCNFDGELQEGLFVFEGASWLWDKEGCMAAQSSHYERVKEHKVSFNTPDQQQILQWIGETLTAGPNANPNAGTDNERHY